MKRSPEPKALNPKTLPPQPYEPLGPKPCKDSSGASISCQPGLCGLHLHGAAPGAGEGRSKELGLQNLSKHQAGIQFRDHGVGFRVEGRGLHLGFRILNLGWVWGLGFRIEVKWRALQTCAVPNITSKVPSTQGGVVEIIKEAWRDNVGPVQDI